MQGIMMPLESGKVPVVRVADVLHDMVFFHGFMCFDTLIRMTESNERRAYKQAAQP